MWMTAKTTRQMRAAMICGAAAGLGTAWLLGHGGVVPVAVWILAGVAVFVWMRRRWPVTPADEPQMPVSLVPAITGKSPESLFEIRVDGDRLVVWHPVEGERSVPLSAIDAVWIETDDSGPWASDVRWVLRAGDATVVIPLGATGEDALLGWVQSLPGVDNEAIVEAMGSTTIGRFPVWTRP